MARRVGILDYLLGGAVGGMEGYAAGRKRVAEEERLRKAEERQKVLDAIQMAGTIKGLDFRPTAVRTTADPAIKDAFALDQPELPTKIDDTAMRSALGKATGLGPTAPSGPLTSPIKLALDTTRNRQVERGAAMQPANPEMQVEVPGMGRIGFRPPETPEEKESARDASISKYLGTLDPQTRGRVEPVINASRAGLPASALDIVFKNAEPRPPRLQIVNGQVVDLDAKSASPIAGYKAPAKTPTGGLTEKQRQDRELALGAAESLFNLPPDEKAKDRMGRAFARLRSAYTQRGINKAPREIMLEVVEGMGLMKSAKPNALGAFDAGGSALFQNEADLQEARAAWDEAAAQTSVEQATAQLGPRP